MKHTIHSILTVLSLFIFLSCAETKKESAEDQMHMMSAEEETLEAPQAPQYPAEETFRSQVNDVFTAYVELKESFVASDLNKVKTSGLKVSDALAKVEGSKLEGAAKMDWTTYSENMSGELRKLKDVTELESARVLLPALTENMYKIIRAYGLNGITAYYAYCPMAFNNKGGYWLSNEKKIRNPYFGDAMLACGGVREQLK